MAHSLSAKKRVRQNIKHRARNRARKMDIREAVKTFTTDVVKADFKKAEQDLKKAVQLMDRVATKGTIHKNAAARKRSRLTRRLNAARTAAASKGAGTQAAKA